MCRSLNPQHQKRQKDSRSPKPVGIYVAPGRAKRLGLRLSFCRFCLEGFQGPTVLILLCIACRYHLRKRGGKVRYCKLCPNPVSRDPCKAGKEITSDLRILVGEDL